MPTKQGQSFLREGLRMDLGRRIHRKIRNRAREGCASHTGSFCAATLQQSAGMGMVLTSLPPEMVTSKERNKVIQKRALMGLTMSVPGDILDGCIVKVYLAALPNWLRIYQYVQRAVGQSLYR